MQFMKITKQIENYFYNKIELEQVLSFVNYFGLFEHLSIVRNK